MAEFGPTRPAIAAGQFIVVTFVARLIQFCNVVGPIVEIWFSTPPRAFDAADNFTWRTRASIQEIEFRI